MQHDQFAHDMAAAHQLLATQLQNLLLSRRLLGDQGVSAHAAATLSSRAYQHAAGYARVMDDLIVRYTASLAGSSFDADLAARGDALYVTLRRMAHMHVAELLRRSRGGGLKMALNQPTTGPLARLLAQREESLTLYAHDSAGRRWPATQLVRFLARDFGYQALIDVSAARIATTADLAQVLYPNPQHEDHALVVSLSGAAGPHPSLASVRATIFHPNASALLQHVQPHL